MVAKEAYYFSHDSNARHDPKITAMRGVYGSEGYGWYWMIVEMMRESEGYKLDMQGKYVWNAFALQLHCECNQIEQYVKDCINEFNLFESDGKYFWSPSLLRRMDIREQKSEIRRKAAKARWDKEKQASDNHNEDANGMQMHSNSSAIGMQGKESKGKESKGNKNKGLKDIGDSNEPPAPPKRFIPPSFEMVKAYCDERKNSVDPQKWYDHYTSNGWKVGKNAMKDWKAAVRTWERSEYGGKKTNSNPKTGKPQIPTVSTQESAPISEAELAELKALAKKFDDEGG